LPGSFFVNAQICRTDMTIPLRSFKAKAPIQWPILFFSLRTKILVGYVLLMLFSTISSTLAIRELLHVYLEGRVGKELERSVGEFQKHVQDANVSSDRSLPNNGVVLFESFISREVIKDRYYVFLADGQVYQTSERKLQKAVNLNPANFDSWSRISQIKKGEIAQRTDSVIYYLAIPISFADGQQGVFVALIDTTGECQKITAVTIIIVVVTLGTLAIALVIAWIFTKRMLGPLQLLTQTSRSIGFTDLTQRIPVRGHDEIAQLTRTFNEMLQRLQGSFDTQKDFFNHASHELKTPLTIIRVNLELLSADPVEQSKTIELVTDELDRMNRYVNDMILLAKSDRPDFLILGAVNLTEFTQEVFAKITALGERNWQLETVGKGIVVCDRHRLTQVLMNLAQNAAQQTERGAEISIGSIMKDGKAHFWVRDCGPGIDPRVHRMIFDRFIRCPDARKRFDGMGLGLAIVKGIVEAHGGQIELVSEMNIGSTFTAIIPIDPPRWVQEVRP
jgi:signal transduction histidine kinase